MSGPGSQAPRPPGIGDAAPPLALPRVGSGELFDLASLRGRAVIVSFLRHAG